MTRTRSSLPRVRLSDFDGDPYGLVADGRVWVVTKHGTEIGRVCPTTSLSGRREWTVQLYPITHLSGSRHATRAQAAYAIVSAYEQRHP